MSRAGNCPEDGGLISTLVLPVLGNDRDGHNLLSPKIWHGQRANPTLVQLFGAGLCGGYLGGIHWGLAMTQNKVYFTLPISDFPAGLTDQ